MLRPTFSLKTMLWLTACVACFFAGQERQRQWDRHWFAGTGGAAADESDFRITIKMDLVNQLRSSSGRTA